MEQIDPEIVRRWLVTSRKDWASISEKADIDFSVISKFIGRRATPEAKAMGRLESLRVESEIKKWLADSRGKQNENGVSVWLEIAFLSKVSIRTLTNICSGTYDVPRQKTLRGLDSVRKRMVKK
jgi:hypothetical protein